MESNTCMRMVLLAAALCLVVLPVSAQQRPGLLTHDLSFSLTISIVAVCVVIMLIVGIVLIYRARKGYFCCLKPRVRYPPVPLKRPRASRRTDIEAPQAAAPTYEVHPRGADIAPPDYEDALQDAVVSTGESQPEHVERDNDSLVDASDQTPLNP